VHSRYEGGMASAVSVAKHLPIICNIFYNTKLSLLSSTDTLFCDESVVL
jgi:hypothetical protein